MERAPLVLVDTHAHLDQLEDPLAEALRAARRGVRCIVGVSMDMASGRTIRELCRRLPGRILPAFGLHPWSISEETKEECLRFVEEHLGEAAAVGEVGLDYRIKTPKPLQKDVLERQLGMAAARQLPVILHCRLSHARVLSMVMAAGIRRAVFHWYSGPLEVLEEIVGNGYFISATPAVQYSPPHREAVSFAPVGSLVLETDSPVEYRGTPSRPADVAEVCRAVALLKGLSAEEVAKATTENALRLFGDRGDLKDPHPLF